MELIPDIAGEKLVAFMLVFARVGGLFMFAPIFSSRLIPVRAKLIVGGAIALALMPIAADGRKIPADPIAVGGLMVKEVAVGLALALAIGVVAAAVQFGASILDTITGFAFASLVDPISNVQSSPVAQLFGVVTVIVFIATGGDHLMIAGLARSYDGVPLDLTPDIAALAALATDGLAQIFVAGLQIAAPVLVALVLTDVALGLVTRAVPQMNVLMVGLPAKILVAFAMVAASLPFIAMRLGPDLHQAILRGVQGIHP